jgi:hypothetical protein
MTDKQPEALRLADWSDWFCRNVKDPEDFRWEHMACMAAELRRLHAENERMQTSCDAYERGIRYLVHTTGADTSRIFGLQSCIYELEARFNAVRAGGVGALTSQQDDRMMAQRDELLKSLNRIRSLPVSKDAMRMSHFVADAAISSATGDVK